MGHGARQARGRRPRRRAPPVAPVARHDAGCGQRSRGDPGAPGAEPRRCGHHTFPGACEKASGEGEAAPALARLVARRQEQGASQLTFGVVFPWSAHAYLLRRWLNDAGIDPAEDVRITVAPPPRMADLLAEGVMEGFCAGEPWNTAAEARGVGVVVARAEQGAPDKVLGVRRDWAERQPEVLIALLRALIRAGAWADAPGNRPALAAILAERLALDAALIVAALEPVSFAAGAANRPTLEDGVRLLGEMARAGQIGPLDAAAVAAQVFRTDLFDRAAQGAIA
ncbi:ABC transporter substrate-binding protein [Phenylobacterium sp. J367]|uniref:ABC transporter substrate-binding protein n=1 Tax=Phenylobacterium sp. J367 TaxID=2898435 RepID=UPI002151F355|nr:ABC transporter substrate-binding protein [Phenylobacterium sp. J367]